MVEKTLIVIITLVFVLSSWWWSNRQNATENFYEEQLRERDVVITQLSALALPQVQGKTSAQVQDLLQGLSPKQDMQRDKDILFSGPLGIRFSKDDVATGFFLPGDAIETAPAQ